MKWTLDEGKEYLQEGEDGHDLLSAAPTNNGVWTLIKIPCMGSENEILDINLDVSPTSYYCYVLWRKTSILKSEVEKIYSSTNITIDYL